jgi:hypothetical protein
MPAVRQPLRQRCNVRLNVYTAIPPEEVLETSARVYDEDVSAQTKSRRPVPDVSVPFNGIAAGKKNPFTPLLHPVSKSAAQRLQSLHELLPYLFVSFHTGNHLPTEVVTDDGAAFTHIVKITHQTSKRKAGLVEVSRDVKRGLHTLILAVPTSTPRRHGRRRVRTTGERNTTLLTEYQLLAARDFLSLALPYYSETHPASEVLEGPIGSADRVRVLVTATAGEGAAADVMSVAVCYITFVSGESAQTVLECIEKEEEVPAIWKDVIGEGEAGIRLVDCAAMMGE